MIIRSLTKFLFISFNILIFNAFVWGQIDTSYITNAPSIILNMLVPGKAPRVTFQLSGYYNVGLLDLAANDNTVFRKSDFENGRNFGTRYGFGVSLTGKIALHKEGNVRLTITPSYQRFLSNFVISESPDGNVAYNVFSGALGIENNFTPTKRFKPYMGFDVIGSWISGNANFKTDSTDFHLDIKSSFRLGFGLNLGFEYAFNNKVGLNLGMKLTHANALLRNSKSSSNPNETYLNDKDVTPTIPYAGWKQFFYASLYGGINFYIGMKNKK
jgi:opacity protein-like surface antigen